MKLFKKGLVFFVLVLQFVFLSSCSGASAAKNPKINPNENNPKPVEYTITYMIDDIIFDSHTLVQDKKTEKIPRKAGYFFENWYSDQECLFLYDFSFYIPTDVTVHAGFVSYETAMVDFLQLNDNVYSHARTQISVKYNWMNSAIVSEFNGFFGGDLFYEFQFDTVSGNGGILAKLDASAKVGDKTYPRGTPVQWCKFTAGIDFEKIVEDEKLVHKDFEKTDFEWGIWESDVVTQYAKQGCDMTASAVSELLETIAQERNYFL